MSKRHTKKGFTFMELVIVIAIFGILVGILTPAWAHYLQRSKYKAQNAKAKAVFNAAQTIITDLDFAERKYRAVLSSQSEVAKYIYTPIAGDSDDTNDEWYYYWNGRQGFRCDSSRNAIAFTAPDGTSAVRQTIIDEWNEKIGRAINRIVSEDMVYVIWVKDYKVQAVVSGNNNNDHYIGAHPTTVLEIKANGGNIDDLKKNTVLDAPLNMFDLDPDND